MPRSHPVNYPQVHPPTVQTYQGLAPPSHEFGNPNRFSWQDSSTDLPSPSHVAEQELETGALGKAQEHTQSGVPPLPTLPDHLGGLGQQNNSHQTSSQEKTIHPGQQDPVTHSPARTEVALHYYQQTQQQPSQFRPDVPRLIQQQYPFVHLQPQTDLHLQPSGPPLSYEASQAQNASQQQLHQASRMQEQPMYPGHWNASNQQMSAHALPLHTSYHSQPIDHVESSDQKPTHQNNTFQLPQQIPSNRPHASDESTRIVPSQQRPAAVYIGPDVHPLSPTTPTMTSPTHMTHNQTFTPSGPNSAQASTFPQVTSFTPPSPQRVGGSWHSSIFSCSNPSICLSSLACPCVIYGRTQYRLSQKSANKDPTNMLGYSAINGSCIAWSVLCGVNILLTAIQHTRIRKKYEMQEGSGNVPGDCVKSLCCCCCVIALDEKEVKIREEGKTGGKEGMVERAYTSPGAMMYRPPPQ